jgi:hypothetical protein
MKSTGLPVDFIRTFIKSMIQMKKNILLKTLVAFSTPFLITACDDDEANNKTAISAVDFQTIASTYYEESAETFTIPFRNVNGGSTDNLDVSLGGSATEGTDYEVVGITSEGVQIKILADGQYESNLTETIRVQLLSENGTPGNNIHTVTVLNNCAEQGGFTPALFPHLVGDDATLDGIDFVGAGDITLAADGEGGYTIDGLNVDFMENVWGEEVQESVPVTVSLDASGNITIAEQYIFTTLYNGNLYDYNIVGTGKLDPCTNTLTITYEMIQDGFAVGAWLHDNGYMTDELFVASFDLSQ